MTSMYELLRLIEKKIQPKKIKFCGRIYEWDETFLTYTTLKDGVHVCLGGVDGEINIFVNAFNENVEIIIEEEKEIEKIKSNGNDFYSEYVGLWIEKQDTEAYCEYLMNKINDLIEEINRLKKEGK